MATLGPMRDAPVTIEQIPADGDEAIACVAAYYRELDERFDGGFDPGAGGYAPPDEETGEVFLVLRIGDRPVGCGMVHRLDGETAEIKRMWIAPEVRGLGLARRLLGDLEERARAMGVARIRLDTNATLGEAQALYSRSGYKPIPRYNDNPYAQLWFEKRIDRSG